MDTSRIAAVLAIILFIISMIRKFIKFAKTDSFKALIKKLDLREYFKKEEEINQQ